MSKYAALLLEFNAARGALVQGDFLGRLISAKFDPVALVWILVASGIIAGFMRDFVDAIINRKTNAVWSPI